MRKCASVLLLSDNLRLPASPSPQSSHKVAAILIHHDQVWKVLVVVPLEVLAGHKYI